MGRAQLLINQQYKSWIYHGGEKPPARVVGTRLAALSGCDTVVQERLSVAPYLILALRSVPSDAKPGNVVCENFEDKDGSLGIKVHSHSGDPLKQVLKTVYFKFRGKLEEPFAVSREDQWLFQLACYGEGLIDVLPEAGTMPPEKIIQMRAFPTGTKRFIPSGEFYDPTKCKSRTVKNVYARITRTSTQINPRIHLPIEASEGRFIVDPMGALYTNVPGVSDLQHRPIDAVQLSPELLYDAPILRIFGLQHGAQSKVLLAQYDISFPKKASPNFSPVNLSNWLAGTSSRPDFIQLQRLQGVGGGRSLQRWEVRVGEMRTYLAEGHTAFKVDTGVRWVATAPLPHMAGEGISVFVLNAQGTAMSQLSQQVIKSAKYKRGRVVRGRGRRSRQEEIQRIRQYEAFFDGQDVLPTPCLYAVHDTQTGGYIHRATKFMNRTIYLGLKFRGEKAHIEAYEKVTEEGILRGISVWEAREDGTIIGEKPFKVVKKVLLPAVSG
jgi:hypothetical protein